MDQPTHSSRRLPTNVWFLAATSYLTDVSSEMLTNLIPLFLVNVLGQRTAIVGLIDGIAETTASLVKIVSGILSDRLGKRKLLTVIGYGLSTLAKPFLYFANSWGWILGVRFTDRVGKGIRTAPRDALLAGSVHPEQRGFAFGLHRAGDTAGAFTGLLIATLIIWLSQSSSEMLIRSTFQFIVLASIVPAALAVLVLALGVKEIAPTASRESNSSKLDVSLDNASIDPTQRLGKRLNWSQLDRRFRWFLLVVVLFTLGNSSDSFIILLGQARGLNVLQLMGMLLTFNAVYSILAGPAGSLSDKIGRRRLILTGWLVYGLIYLGFAASQSGVAVWVLFGLYGFYYALTEGAAKALVADLVPQEQRGAAYGFYNAAIGLTAMPASLIAGLLWQGVGAWAGFGPSSPFLFGAMMALLAGVLFSRLR